MGAEVRVVVDGPDNLEERSLDSVSKKLFHCSRWSQIFTIVKKSRLNRACMNQQKSGTRKARASSRGQKASKKARPVQPKNCSTAANPEERPGIGKVNDTKSFSPQKENGKDIISAKCVQGVDDDADMTDGITRKATNNDTTVLLGDTSWSRSELTYRKISAQTKKRDQSEEQALSNKHQKKDSNKAEPSAMAGSLCLGTVSLKTNTKQEKTSKVLASETCISPSKTAGEA